VKDRRRKKIQYWGQALDNKRTLNESEGPGLQSGDQGMGDRSATNRRMASISDGNRLRISSLEGGHPRGGEGIHL